VVLSSVMFHFLVGSSSTAPTAPSIKSSFGYVPFGIQLGWSLVHEMISEVVFDLRVEGAKVDVEICSTVVLQVTFVNSKFVPWKSGGGVWDA